MVMASHCVGLTLPGMMLLPGSFSGRLSSPSPHRGPLPRNLMSLAICRQPHPPSHAATWHPAIAASLARLLKEEAVSGQELSLKGATAEQNESSGRPAPS